MNLRLSPNAYNVDLVYFGGIYTEGAVILRQMRESGLTAPFLGGDGLFSSEFSAIAGPEAEGSAFVTFGPDPTKNTAAKEVVTHFAAKNLNPEGNTLYAYAAVQVIAQAIEA
ncbi:ABC transporter substrate-binding protein [Sinorhizobium meliloti]|nr:ABC transporter substrate-binding protein [Sinorhizobium meliloti]